MKKESILLFLLATIQFSDILDFMIIMPLGSQFMRLFEITPRQFSLIVSIYALSAFAMGLLGAGFIDRRARDGDGYDGLFRSLGRRRSGRRFPGGAILLAGAVYRYWLFCRVYAGGDGLFPSIDEGSYR